MPGLLRNPRDVLSDGPYGDFRDQLKSEGYAIIKDVISPEKVQQYVNRTMTWLEKLDYGFDRTKPETWVASKLPVHGPSGIISHYAVGHEDFVWDARCEPGVLKVFQTLWQTPKLLASFDAINVSLPKRSDDFTALKFWPHIDQDPAACADFDLAQGIINLSHVGPKDGGLCVMAKSSALMEEFFGPDGPTFEGESAEKKRIFTEEHVKWFESKGCRWVKVEAEPGDVILWDSRTMHYGAPAEGEVTRVVYYVNYAPASLISPSALENKKEIFKSYRITGHNPLNPKPHKPTAIPMRDGLPETTARIEPMGKPDWQGNKTLARLAGMEAY